MTDCELVGFSSTMLDAVAQLDEIGVDTEFVREKTFQAELCLVQVATPGEILCLDPLAGNGSADTAAWRLLTRPTWIVHSGRQDIEVIFQTAGMMPARLFDTQIAAALAGMQPQIGYAGLVKALFDIDLDKSQTRSDWARRPLDAAMLRYAAEDVTYLLAARDELGDRLERKGRLDWATEDSAELLDERLYANDPAQAVHRLKGARNLRGRRYAAAARLAAWREDEAQRLNKPRQWILRDAVMLEIAAALPETRNQLAGINGLPEKTVRRIGDELLDLVKRSADDDADHRPPARPDEAQKAAMKRMQQLVQRRSTELDIAAEVIAPRKELSAAMLGERDLRVLRGWRRDVVGGDLLALLE